MAMAQRATLEAPTVASAAQWQASSQMASSQMAWLVPVWRSPDGHWVASLDEEQWHRAPLQWVATEPDAVDRGVLSLGNQQASAAGVTVAGGSRLYTGVRLKSITAPQLRQPRCGNGYLFHLNCSTPPQTWQGGSLVGGYHGDGLLIDVGIDWLQHEQPGNNLYLVVPDTEQARLMGIPSRWVDSFKRIEASGRLDLGDHGAYLDMGASIGRVHLVPVHARMRNPNASRLLSGAPLGLDHIDQKSVSVGLGKGAISGFVVGRVMQPEASGPLAIERDRWSAVDLGITVRLPWEGELKLGAQNLWSSADDSDLPSGPTDPIQGRIPYIQYHQNL